MMCRHMCQASLGKLIVIQESVEGKHEFCGMKLLTAMFIEQRQNIVRGKMAWNPHATENVHYLRVRKRRRQCRRIDQEITTSNLANFFHKNLQIRKPGLRQLLTLVLLQSKHSRLHILDHHRHHHTRQPNTAEQFKWHHNDEHHGFQLKQWTTHRPQLSIGEQLEQREHRTPHCSKIHVWIECGTVLVPHHLGIRSNVLVLSQQSHT
mmetsp:Transcript_22/g.52  ORF Transcript_22/g.52 Transcript_22/m.52 type:complete len:207 (+) Transcript_22:1001-1621(+)